MKVLDVAGFLCFFFPVCRLGKLWNPKTDQSESTNIQYATFIHQLIEGKRRAALILLIDIFRSVLNSS